MKLIKLKQCERFNQSLTTTARWKMIFLKSGFICSLSVNIGLSIVIEAGAGGSAAENHYRKGIAGNKQTTSKINLFLA